MRTTIRLPDDLYDEVRRQSLDRGRTVTSYIEDALRAALRLPDGPPPAAFRVDAFHGSGTLPGVDLDDSARLLEQMEAEPS